ncbi:hypothetical protein EV13_2589 [Prochlorococcus sp. MIT 0702]|nr:hypothetical protein EV12_2378 [Prochlorococcus sp. MIT 0701]KGG26455.1 hypothetical protein EV13_2589 [Prochlorococcus sp. MIT 0702]KGG31123.1 hypothetical protein EV14_2494 [Prochlorococcus sp. MIT 0703]
MLSNTDHDPESIANGYANMGCLIKKRMMAIKENFNPSKSNRMQ